MNNRIEEYRRPLGLSQHRLGKEVGISRISINKIETGKTIPSLKTASVYADSGKISFNGYAKIFY